MSSLTYSATIPLDAQLRSQGYDIRNDGAFQHRTVFHIGTGAVIGSMTAEEAAGWLECMALGGLAKCACVSECAA